MTAISNVDGSSSGGEVRVLKRPNKDKIGALIKRPSKSEKDEIPNVDYNLGAREGNTRIVGVDSIATTASGGRPFAGCLTVYLQSDAHFGTSNQGARGDCYFLAEINAIRNTEDGQQILSQNVRANSDGSITVTLPGAIAIRNQYINEGKGDKCEITGVYHITAEAVLKAKSQAGKTYSKGDIDVIALEIAMESYHAEMVKTKKNLGITDEKWTTAEGATNHLHNTDNYLHGGYTQDAGFILTAQKSEVYQCSTRKRDNISLYHDGKYGYITREEMERQTQGGVSEKGISEVTHITYNDSDLDKMLDNYAGKEGDYAITCSVVVAKTDSDGVTKAGNGHAITVVKITDSTVYVANPWHPDKIEPIPRAEFEKMATGLTVQKMDTESVTNNSLVNTHNSIINGSAGNSNIPPNQFTSSLQNILNKISANHSGMSSSVPNADSRLNTAVNNYLNSRKDVNADDVLRIFNNLSTKELSADEAQDFETFIGNLSTTDKQEEIFRYIDRLMEMDKK